MKKMTKALLMTALCMGIVGTAFCIAGICLGFSFRAFTEAADAGEIEIQVPLQDSFRVEDRTVCNYEQRFHHINSLDLELGVAQCSLILWEEDDICVKGYNLPSGFDCRKDGKELEIDWEDQNWKWWENQKKAVLEIYIPEKHMLEKVALSAGIGEVAVKGGYLSCDRFDLDSGVGNCDLKLDIQDKLDIDGGVGEVALELKGKETDFNYDIDSGIGEVVIGESRWNGLGTDEQMDHGASREVAIDNGIGSVTIRFSEN